jgi:hypothetical protein
MKERLKTADPASAEAADPASAEATDPASAEATDPASAEATDPASAEATDPASAEAADLHQLPTQVQKTKAPQPLLGSWQKKSIFCYITRKSSLLNYT